LTYYFYLEICNYLFFKDIVFFFKLFVKVFLRKIIFVFIKLKITQYPCRNRPKWIRMCKKKILFQNCGPRPQGIDYPFPPRDSKLDPLERLPCDIFPEKLYLPNYHCEAPCLIQPNQTIQLTCNCYEQFDNFKLVKKCEWEIIGEACPPVPENQEKNWDCDPRSDSCPGQYGEPLAKPEAEIQTTGEDWLWDNFGIPTFEFRKTDDGKFEFESRQRGVINVFNISPIMTNLIETNGQDFRTDENGKPNLESQGNDLVFRL